MKKLLVIVMLCMSIFVSAQSIVGVWNMSICDWKNKVTSFAKVEFVTNNTYFINQPGENQRIGRWKLVDDYYYLGEFGFILKWVNDDKFYLIPAFGDTDAKYYIFQKK